MSGQVTVPLPARRKGGRGRGDAATRAANPSPFPAPERIPRVARVLALAHHWQGLIRAGAVRNQAELARLVGVSRARVTQVLSLMRLDPKVQEAVLLLEATGCANVTLREGDLRPVAATVDWQAQRNAWARLRGIGLLA